MQASVSLLTRAATPLKLLLVLKMAATALLMPPTRSCSIRRPMAKRLDPAMACGTARAATARKVSDLHEPGGTGNEARAVCCLYARAYMRAHTTKRQVLVEVRGRGGYVHTWQALDADRLTTSAMHSRLVDPGVVGRRNPCCCHTNMPVLPNDLIHHTHTLGRMRCPPGGCLKKYCECFQGGIYCSEICKCHDCRNYEGSEARAHVMRLLGNPALPPPQSATGGGGSSSGGGAAHPALKRQRLLGAAGGAAVVPGGPPVLPGPGGLPLLIGPMGAVGAQPLPVLMSSAAAAMAAGVVGGLPPLPPQPLPLSPSQLPGLMLAPSQQLRPVAARCVHPTIGIWWDELICVWAACNGAWWLKGGWGFACRSCRQALHKCAHASMFLRD